jgi:hypothetical protein
MLLKTIAAIIVGSWDKQGEGSGARQGYHGKKPVVQVKQGKLNFTSMVNTLEGAPALAGIFSIRGFSVKVLFDFGVTHSFINENFLSKLGLKSCHVNRPFLVTPPAGRVTTRNLVLRVPLELGSKVVPTNLMALSLEGIDVILGMDWLTQHQVILDIATRMIEINSPIVGTSTLYLPSNGSGNSYAFIAITCLLDDIPIVCEYPTSFPMACLHATRQGHRIHDRTSTWHCTYL